MEKNNFHDILNKFTYHFKRVLINAQNLAYAKKQQEIEPVDLLTSLINTKGALGLEILLKQKSEDVNLKTEVNAFSAPFDLDPSQLPQPSEDAQKIIEKAVTAAFRHQHKYIGTEHLLWGLTESDNLELLKLWQEYRLNIKSIQQNLNLMLKSTSKFNELTGEETTDRELETLLENNTGDNSALGSFTINLTDREIQKDIDPVIGRQLEIDRLIQILSRRTKNNPVLLGDAGVGKTAIIEGLAKRITEGNVPDVLLNKTILTVDLSSLIAGTMYRGEFESRLKQLIAEVTKNKNTILFIDELHTIIGTGAVAGSLDAANILKPALARGQLRCIGATTFEEYKKTIENDKALERRFQPIVIDESSEEETEEILRGLKENYERFHNVTITDSAITTAVKLSKKFLPDKKLPDKAIDLIDETAAKLKVRETKSSLAKKIKELEGEIILCQQNKREAILAENYLQALDYKNQEDELTEKLLRLTALQDKNQNKNLGIIDEQDIKEVLSKITGIPLQSLTLDEQKRLVHLEKYLANNIFGQDKALSTVASSIRKAKAGLADHNKPLASFMFLGPTGVGKTLTAKELSKYLFGGQQNLIRIDMSEFSESFNISKLIGAPAGYVGYKEGNKFTDLVKKKPYSLILFDEIEKAHPDVFNLLLPILEEGELTDATGRTINFRNTVIIMTSNVGLMEFNQEATLGFNLEENKQTDNFQKTSQKILESLHQYFPPEFLNRLDNIIVFEALTKAAAKQIIKRELENLSLKLKEQNITLEYDTKIITQLLKDSQATKEGARSLKRLVDEKIANPLAAKILDQPTDKIKISLAKNEIKLK